MNYYMHCLKNENQEVRNAFFAGIDLMRKVFTQAKSETHAEIFSSPLTEEWVRHLILKESDYDKAKMAEMKKTILTHCTINPFELREFIFHPEKNENLTHINTLDWDDEITHEEYQKLSEEEQAKYDLSMPHLVLFTDYDEQEVIAYNDRIAMEYLIRNDILYGDNHHSQDAVMQEYINCVREKRSEIYQDDKGFTKYYLYSDVISIIKNTLLDIGIDINLSSDEDITELMDEAAREHSESLAATLEKLEAEAEAWENTEKMLTERPENAGKSPS